MIVSSFYERYARVLLRNTIKKAREKRLLNHEMTNTIYITFVNSMYRKIGWNEFFYQCFYFVTDK